MWESNGRLYETIGTYKNTNKVCVECFTYNQVDYIKGALDGILDQKTNFPYLTIIIDDASTDGTSEVIREYVNEFPDRIFALIAKENVYGKKDAINIYSEIKRIFYGDVEYVATCEGDDYWIDNNKLQIQVDYMDAHPDCMMYLHNSYLLDCESNVETIASPFEEEGERDLTAHEIISIKNGHPATASRFYRRELIVCPDFVKECSVGDYPLMLYALSQGKVHYSNRVMCVYRYMSKNSTTKMSEKLEYIVYHHLGLLIFLREFDIFTKYKYHTYISEKINDYGSSIAYTVAIKIGVRECWLESSKKYYLKKADVYIPSLVHLRNQFRDEQYLEKNVRRYVNKHRNIVIMGIGVAARMVTKQMENNGVKVCGYAITTTNNGRSFYMDKPVWALSDFPFEMENVGIIVAIIPKENDGVKSSLHSAGISDYVWPFDVNEYLP